MREVRLIVGMTSSIVGFDDGGSVVDLFEGMSMSDFAAEYIFSKILRRYSLTNPWCSPCCVMPSLFPYWVQRQYNNNPVRSYSTFCQYLLDMAPSDDEEFLVDYLPFVGRNEVIYRGS